MTFSSGLPEIPRLRSWCGGSWKTPSAPLFLDELFESVSERQYTRTLLFSSVVDLMGLVVNRIRPAVNAAYHARCETIGVVLKSVYNKLDNLEPVISAVLARDTAARLESASSRRWAAPCRRCCRAIA